MNKHLFIVWVYAALIGQMTLFGSALLGQMALVCSDWFIAYYTAYPISDAHFHIWSSAQDTWKSTCIKDNNPKTHNWPLFKNAESILTSASQCNADNDLFS